jgi:hypothetical protein
MHYLCLCHYDAAQFATLGPADFEEIGRICAPHDRALKESGHLLAVGGLGMPDSYRTLRADPGGVRVEAGPNAETAEPFGAFFLIEADSMDQAEEIARLHPGTHLGARFRGGIEIRPIDGLERL